MIADEALYLGAPLAHVAAFREKERIARIDRVARQAVRSRQRDTGTRQTPTRAIFS
jgi:hypothetical protein